MFYQIPGQSKVEIFPETESKFFAKTTDTQIEFANTKTEITPILVFVQGGQRKTATRINK